MKILVTSALLYANGPLHFGHLVGAYLPADVYTRAMKLMGHKVLFISGSDEYGFAITMSAELAGRSPKEHVDHYHEVNKDLFRKLDVGFDHYSRTTWSGHREPVQKFFLDLLKNGFIEERETEQLYSPEEDKFLADRYVMGICPKCGFDKARGDECTSCGSSFEATELLSPKSKLSGKPLVLKKTTEWFLLLDKMKEQLTDFVKKKDWKPNVLNFVLEYIKDLRPRSITRDMNWGIPLPLPNAEGKVLYVWFDAPIGYVSATMEYAISQGDPDLWKSYWLDPETKLVHFIGKDNIPFHAVIFPAMCLGQDLPLKLVDELPANEFLNLEGRQFSKSDNWTIDLEEFLKKFSTDQVRYALGANAPENGDAEFSFKDFQNKCNNDLVGKLGNFVNRTLTFIHKNGLKPKFHKKEAGLNNCFPSEEVTNSGYLRNPDAANHLVGLAKQGDEKDPNLSLFQREMNDSTQPKKDLNLDDLVKEAKECYSSFRMRRATQVLMEIAQRGNVYFDQNQPWKLIKDPSKKEELENVLYQCLECIKLLALVAYPIIPSSAEKAWSMLGFKGKLIDHLWDDVVKMNIDSHLPEPALLFSKVEDNVIEEEINKLHAGKKKISEKEFVPYEQFDKLDFRVGTIVSAEWVPKSDRLLVLKVDIETGVRQIVAGIGKVYDPKSIIGKKVIVVANLQPAKMMGVVSEGMILTGTSQDLLELPLIESLPNGTRVK